MARGLNKVMLIGNLGNAPDVRTTAGGMTVAKLSVATASSRKDPQTGNWVEETEWHRVALFGKIAEVAQQYLHKGSKVYIEGRLKTNKWQDDSGNDRYTTEVICNEMQMLDSRGGSGNNSHHDEQAHEAPQQPAPQAQQSHPVPNDFDDDIPF
jgi:single-strand DNA-binding protein